jgi:hypothetical protein
MLLCICAQHWGIERVSDLIGRSFAQPGHDVAVLTSTEGEGAERPHQTLWFGDINNLGSTDKK